MCLAVPGRVVSRRDDFAKVDFGGVCKEISLVFTPEARAGDYVLVHVGFALAVIDQAEAGRIFEALDEIS
jgi:hydrogenase expression/formation protein HypC